MKIGFAGVGGIGSNVAANLVRSGVDNLKLIDFDMVERSNLNRQFYFQDQIGHRKVEALAQNLRRIRSGLVLELIVQRLDQANSLPLFTGCDLVVEGLDSQRDKKMLVEQLAGDMIVVSACGITGVELHSIKSRRLGGCIVLGDLATDCQNAPLFAHKVIAVACHMTEQILQLLAERGKVADG